jgi:putative nucleotide binding protein
MQILRDDNCIVLDFLPRGHATGRGEPIVQVLGEKYFSLLEVVVKKELNLKPGDKIYIGEGKRDQVDYIKRRVPVNDLTTFAKSELPVVIEKLVKENEPRFVDFFNKSTSISTRIHQLELLPGVGKKHMWDIINEREKNGPFKNFDDLKKRIHLLPDPVNAIVRRIMQELENENERFHLFVIVPQKRF